VLAILLGAYLVPDCAGYSVLSHEAIIDAAWNDGIRPLLFERFPSATPEELLQAHAYAYGGAIIQDMGYPSAADSSVISRTMFAAAISFSRSSPSPTI
jgi:hypothetical protein